MHIAPPAPQHHRARGSPFTSSASARARVRTPVSNDRVGWKLSSETVILLGWGPAILMQLAHPLVAAGVADHSIFLARPDQRLRRFQQTVAAMLALTFGTDEEVTQAARGITAIHDRVHGRLREEAGPFPAGTPCSTRYRAPTNFMSARSRLSRRIATASR